MAGKADQRSAGERMEGDITCGIATINPYRCVLIERCALGSALHLEFWCDVGLARCAPIITGRPSLGSRS